MQLMNKIQKSAEAMRNCLTSRKPSQNIDARCKSTKKVLVVTPTISCKKFTTLDWYGHLNPITETILEMEPDAHNVELFSRMHTYALLREAKDPKKEFEVERFMELHRRATEYWVSESGKRRENWDTVYISPDDERRNARFVRLYDRKWGIGKGDRSSFRSLSSMVSMSS